MLRGRTGAAAMRQICASVGLLVNRNWPQFGHKLRATLIGQPERDMSVVKLGVVTTLFFATMGGVAAQTVPVAPPPNLPDPDNKGRWVTKAPVPTERTEVSVAELDGKLWLIGGYVLGSVTSNLLQS